MSEEEESGEIKALGLKEDRAFLVQLRSRETECCQRDECLERAGRVARGQTT